MTTSSLRTTSMTLLQSPVIKILLSPGEGWLSTAFPRGEPSTELLLLTRQSPSASFPQLSAPVPQRTLKALSRQIWWKKLKPKQHQLPTQNSCLCWASKLRVCQDKVGPKACIHGKELWRQRTGPLQSVFIFLFTIYRLPWILSVLPCVFLYCQSAHV